MNGWLRLCAIVLALLTAGAARAHKPSDAYLFVTVDSASIDVRWDIALRDLDVAFDLDADGDRALTWGEVKAHFDEIDRYARAALVVDDGRCPLVVGGHALDRHSDGAYLVLQLTARCEPGPRLKLDYRLFAEIDPTHRGIVRVTYAGAAPFAVVIDPAGGPRSVTRTGENAARDPSADPFASGFFPAGIHHILVGYDHVLFLVCLLLPAVLSWRDGTWRPVPRWTDAVRPVLITVTAFTIAHTVTLALAGLRIVELPSRVIEPAIAATIVFTAVGNLRPTRFRQSAAMPFAFGLVHGFGFADVLHELDLPPIRFAWALVRFNLGVEAGQLLIVSLVLLPLLLLRAWPAYRKVVVIPLSLFAIGVATVWFCERIFDFKVLPW